MCTRCANGVTREQKRGDLEGGKTIIDATSGNTGIGYALVGAAKGACASHAVAGLGCNSEC